jgi:hypothetical protein
MLRRTFSTGALTAVILPELALAQPASGAALATPEDARLYAFFEAASMERLRLSPEAMNRGSGGPAASGGFNYQAAVTSVAMAHALAGARLGWLDELTFDAPVELAVETNGPGDDLRLILPDEEVAEIQIKKGLRAGKDLAHALAALADGLAAKTCSYALLVVDTSSSAPVRQGLPSDLRRLHDDPNAAVGPAAEALRAHLVRSAQDISAVCGKLRVVTVAAVDPADAAIGVAIAHLARVCQRPEDAQAAWNRLYRDAHVIMSRRGRRTRSAIADVLRSAGIRLSADPTHGPAALLTKLCDWTAATTAQFTILGVPKPLSIDDAWLEVSALVRESGEDLPSSSLEAALANYHNPSGRGGGRDDGCKATTLGRFRRHVVVISGPGSGKTTLLKKLARVYAAEGFPVLRFSAKAVARRMAAAGEGLLTAVFALGLEGSGIAPEAASAAGFGNWVLLCDGLDECGAQQDEVADGLLQVASGAPGMRIIATTRMIGYRPAKLAAWRHYDLSFADGREAHQQVDSLLTHILPEDARKLLHRRVEEALEDSDAGKTVARSPLLVGLCAALFARGAPLGRTPVQFYRAVFDLLEREPPPRAPAPPSTAVVRARCLDILGWVLTTKPQVLASDALNACAGDLGGQLEIPPLKAQDLAASCLDYWQALGVVEHLHHGNDQVLAFVHKTFGEFAAARYLSALPPAGQEAVLKADAEESAMSEVIAFASGLGVGPVLVDELFRRGFDGLQGQTRLLQAIETLGHARPPLDTVRMERIVEVATARIAGSHRTWALETADDLAEVAAVIAPQLVPALEPLCESDQLWTSLAAWTLRIIAEADRLDLAAAIDALHSFPELRIDDLMSEIEGRMIIGRRTGRDLIQRMALAVAERCLNELSAADGEAELQRFGPLMSVGTANFYQALVALVNRYEVKLPTPSWAKDYAGLADLMQIPVEHRGALDALLQTIQDGDAPVQATPSDRPLYALSAFLHLIGFWRETPGEIWVWKRPFDRQAAAAVFRALATQAGLALDDLASEAATLRQEIAAAGQPDLDAMSLLFRRAPSVDGPEADLNGPIKSDIAFDSIERALYHLSALVIVPALNLATAVGTADDWRRAARALLATGRHESLWAAGHLAAALPLEESADLLFSHLASPARPGTEHVFESLTAIGLVEHPIRRAALAEVLFSKRVKVAVAAADWVAKRPSIADPDERVLLRQAFDHWMTAEEPYPTKGGVVPDSPRSKLATALYDLGALDFSTLMAWTSDIRSDVRDVARHSLMNLFTHDPAARADFIELAFSGAISVPTLRDILEKSQAFAPDETQRLLDLLDSPEPKIRFLAMALLDRPSVDREQRAGLLARLRDDPISEIRERAIRMGA